MEDFEENDEMAAMMGFSSFGGTKKRKFDQASSPKASDEYSASGANSTELGVRTKVSSKEEQSALVHDATSPPQTSSKPPPQASGLASFLARGQGLPEKPPKAAHGFEEAPGTVDASAPQTISFGGPAISQAELNALKFGIKDQNGVAAYFLPSFVEDPWERLISSR